MDLSTELALNELAELSKDGMRILSLDPGGTTGYCMALYMDNTLHMSVGESRFSMDEMYNLLSNFIQGSDAPAHVIYEDFQYRNYARMNLDLTPVKLIGVIEVFRERHEPLVGFHVQSAATGKAFWSDDRLKRHNVYMKGAKHGRDAVRHLLQWAMFGAGGQYIDMDNCNLRLTGIAI